MEMKFISEEAYQQLIDKIDAIAGSINKKSKENPLSEIWLDIQEVCQLLKVSKRTLQSYRDNRVLPFSKVAGKIYFRASDIEAHLEKHYQKISNS